VSFGQQSGPPASDKQVQYLLALVRKAGYTDFREARHPMSLNQRQARGKFTRLEASELIDRLLGDDADDDEGAGIEASPPATKADAQAPRAAPARGRTLRELPLERLVAELERRGFRVVPGDEDTGPTASQDQDGSIP
jgi:hypothetical protein